MSKRFSWTGRLLMIALLVLSFAAAAGAAEPPAGWTPAVSQGSGCPPISSVKALDGVISVAPSWMQATPVPCGPGCPAIGTGTDPACTGKRTGDACGAPGDFCLQVLSTTCPRSAAQCICYDRITPRR